MVQFQVSEICRCFRLIFRKKSRTIFSDLFRTLALLFCYLLFLLYRNCKKTPTKPWLFADDTNLIASVVSVTDLEAAVNFDLENG